MANDYDDDDEHDLTDPDCQWTAEVRRRGGEAYMMCHDCGARLYSFDGNEDRDRGCPYMRHGKCEP